MRFSLLALAPAVALGTGNAALKKIIEMLGEMETRGKKEKQAEAVAFAAFNTWCDNTQAEKSADIKASEDAITQFQAAIEQAQAQAAEANDAYTEADNKVAAEKENIEAMTKVRQQEKALFIQEKTDLNDSIYAAEKAIEALSAVPEKVEAVSSFLQTKQSKRINQIQSLLETVQAAENPFTSAVESRSGVVVEMLEKLKEEFQTELQTKTKDEGDKKHAFDMGKQESEQNIAANEKLAKEQRAVEAEAQAAEGSNKKDLDTEEQSKADDTKYLKEITADCSLKKKDFEGRQKSRADELTAIAEAISILNSPEVQKGAGHLNKAQSVGSFLQLARGDPSAQERAVAFLRSRANAIHSTVLTQLAELAGADPFVKVKKMIKDLIQRLEEEAKAELTKKGKCDKDMAENKAKIEEFTTLTEKLTAEVETLTSEVAQATATKKRLTKEIAENRKNEAEAKKQRIAEKTENEKVISESQAALDALDQAMATLQNYYSKVGGSAFVQVKQPEFEAGEYKGMGGGGVLGLLEVIKSQTDQLIKETTQAESDAATAHSDFITESQSSLAKKTNLLRSTEETLAQKKEDLTDKKDALEGEDGSKAQLAAYKKEKNEVIDPQCTVQGVSFEERNKKRQEEIQSLTEALDILGQMAP